MSVAAEIMCGIHPCVLDAALPRVGMGASVGEIAEVLMRTGAPAALVVEPSTGHPVGMVFRDHLRRPRVA